MTGASHHASCIIVVMPVDPTKVAPGAYISVGDEDVCIYTELKEPVKLF
jgi:hypothetical protein